MRKLTAADPETRSSDIVTENVNQLRVLFPEAFTEGKIDLEVLKQLLGANVEEREEKFGLNWHGKRRARQIALTPSTGTLRPCPKESVDWDKTRNLMIEGDNLEVLKLLQKSYAGKVKLIYIDPPYNTGKDFVYPDDFRDNIKNYLELTGQVEGGRKISSNAESNGRFHTDWLSMMYPRLKLARNLLREDGFIVISIDDAELRNLQIMMDELFGEENFIAVLVFDRNRKNDAKLFSVGHEYMLVYSRNKAIFAELNIVLRSPKEGIEEVRAEFERLRKLHSDEWTLVEQGLRAFYAAFNEDDPRFPLTRFAKVDERGPYRTDGDPSWPGGGGPRYEVIHPVTGKPCKIPSRGWVWSTLERMREEIEKGNIAFGPDESTVPAVRRNLFEKSDQVMRSVQFSYAQKASQDFSRLFDGMRVFDNPKSYEDIEHMINYLSSPGDMILDFFAGSGTTGHSVYLSNKVSNTQRRFICVQLPEPLDSEGKEQKAAFELCNKLGKPHTIAELTKERLRRAGAKIREDNPLFPGDLGFRVFKLDSSNVKAWEPDPDDVEQSLQTSIDHLISDRTEQDILFEVLLKLGLDLTIPIDERQIVGHRVHSIGAGVLLVCLSTHIPRDGVEPLALGLVNWHREQAPVGEVQVVFRDSAFDDDVAKTNLTAILQQYGLSNVRSL